MKEIARTEESADVENGRHRSSVIIGNPQGLHMRPASAFAMRAQSFASNVAVWKGDQCVNGKSLIDLLMLGAESGTELIVEVHGQDAPSALSALIEILAAPNSDVFDIEQAN
jgi:phosphotransferase system HPr (HPr) family protein